MASIVNSNKESTPSSFFHTIKCGVNTAAKLALSVLQVEKAPPEYLSADQKKAMINLDQWGHQFTASTLNTVLKEMHKGYEKSLTLAHVGTFHGFFKKVDGEGQEIQVDERRNFSKFLAIPYIVQGTLGNHIALLLVERIAPGKPDVRVEFYDGKALPIDHLKNQHVKGIYDNLGQTFNIVSFHQLKTPVQFDGHNCGALICWFIEQRLRGKTLEEIQAQKPDMEEYRSYLGGLIKLFSEDSWAIIENTDDVEEDWEVLPVANEKID
jgi:hypothetical protein